MTAFMADMLTECLFKNGLIRNCDKAIYHYSIQVLIEKIAGFSIILLLSIKWRVLLESLFFTAYFSCIRKYAGGFHAKSFWGCFAGTVGIYTAYVKVFYGILRKNMGINMLLLLTAGISVFVIGAVNHPDMDWSKEEYSSGKKVTRMLVILEICSIIVLFLLGMEERYILYMSFGIILSAILLFLGKIAKQEVKMG